MTPRERCPICEGRGVVAYPPNTPATQREFTSSSCGPWPCPLCKGALTVSVPPEAARTMGEFTPQPHSEADVLDEADEYSPLDDITLSVIDNQYLVLTYDDSRGTAHHESRYEIAEIIPASQGEAERGGAEQAFQYALEAIRAWRDKQTAESWLTVLLAVRALTPLYARSAGEGTPSRTHEVHSFRGLTMTNEKIAEVCHELNRAFCRATGDDSQPSWADAPDWQKSSAVSGVEGIMKGTVRKPSESHESWLEEKRAAGWKYGPVKNPEAKEHPCFVAYAELPPEQRIKDTLFFQAATALLSL